MNTTKIPLDAVGITLLISSILVNFFVIYIMYKIMKREIPHKKNVKYLMLSCNFAGILWALISITRYYYYSFPYTGLIHYFVGMSVMTGDLMGQFEILKLFHSISGLSRLFVLYFQITLFLVFTTGFSGSFFVALFPDVTWVQLWGLNGPFVSLIVLALFYLWFQGFLTTKLYQSMLISVEIEEELVKERKCKYCRLMKEYTLLGFCFVVGIASWIWGTTHSAESKWGLVFIRIGESVAQVHIACSSLFVKHIKEFKFPVEKKNTDTKTTVKVRDLVSKKNFMSYQNTPTVRLQPGDSEIMLKLTRNSLSQGGS